MSNLKKEDNKMILNHKLILKKFKNNYTIYKIVLGHLISNKNVDNTIYRVVADTPNHKLVCNIIEKLIIRGKDDIVKKYLVHITNNITNNLSITLDTPLEDIIFRDNFSRLLFICKSYKNNIVDFKGINYNDATLDLPDKKLMIDGQKVFIYSGGIKDPLYRLELKLYIHHLYEWKEYVYDSDVNILKKLQAYIVLGDGEKVNFYINLLMLNMVNKIRNLDNHEEKNIKIFLNLLNILVSLTQYIFYSANYFVEKFGYFSKVNNFYLLFDGLIHYTNGIDKNFISKYALNIELKMVRIFTYYAQYAASFQEVKKINNYLEKVYSFFKIRHIDLLCISSTRCYYKNDCAYERLAREELLKINKKNMNIDIFYNYLRLNVQLNMPLDDLSKYYIHNFSKKIHKNEISKHISILNILTNDQNNYTDFINILKKLLADNQDNRKVFFRISFILIVIYRRIGDLQQAIELFNNLYTETGCTNSNEAMQYINQMDLLGILVEKQSLFEELYYQFIFLHLYKKRNSITTMIHFLDAQLKITKIYNMLILQRLHDRYMYKKIDINKSKDIIVLNAINEMNNYMVPIHLYKKIIDKNDPIVNFTKSNIDFFNDNSILYYLNELNESVIGITKHWNKDFNIWKISFENKEVICNGINMYQTFFEQVSRAQKVFSLDWNSQVSKHYFNLFKRRVDRNIFVYNKFRLEYNNIRVKYLSITNHYTPWSYFFTYFLYKNNPKYESFIHVTSTYENYISDMKNQTLSTVTALNLIKYNKSRTALFGSSEKFTDWSRKKINSFEIEDTKKNINNATSAINSNLVDKILEAKEQGKTIACALGKIVYDLSVPYMGGTFNDIKEWAQETEKIFLERDDLFLLVKPHPHELKTSISQVPNESFLDFFKKNNKKIYKLGHNEASLDDLMPYVDVFLLWNGTSVIELSKNKKNIIVCDDWAIKDYPIGLYKPENKQQYLDKILTAKNWNENSKEALYRTKMANLFEIYLQENTFTVNNVGVVRSSTNIGWGLTYLRTKELIREFKKPTQDWGKLIDNIYDT